MFKPICMENQLLIPEDCTAPRWAVCSLWTPVDKVLAEIRSRGLPVPAVIGQLYNAAIGIDPLIRNLLANPQVDHLLVVGEDKGYPSCRAALRDCLTGDVQFVGQDLRDALVVDGLGEVLVLDDHTNDLSVLAMELGEPWETDEPAIFPPPPPLPLDRAVGPCLGGLIRADSITEAWLRILDYVMRYGSESATHYDTPQCEVYGLQVVLNGREEAMPSWVPTEGWAKYASDLWEGVKPETTAYTYGWLMREPVDQIEGMIAKLIENPDQRSAVAGLWRPEHGLQKTKTPCVNTVQCRCIDGEFHMSLVIRSNDMFSAWPMNVRGFRVFQEQVLRTLQSRSSWWLSVRLGATITYSQSAHVYANSWDAARRVVADNWQRYCGMKAQPRDPFGNWLITVDPATWYGQGRSIHLSLLDGEARPSANFVATSAVEAINRIAPYIQNSRHALYLGTELQRAQTAIDEGREYTQDRGGR